MKLIKTNDGHMIENDMGEYLSDDLGNNLFETIEEAKTLAAQQKIKDAAQRVQLAIDQNLPAYIVRSRRNSLAVACSDAAMLEAFIKLERA